MEKFTSLGFVMLDYRVDVLDAGTTLEYGQYILEHLAPRLFDPDEPIALVVVQRPQRGG